MKKICLFGDSISKGVVIDSLHSRYTMTKNNFTNILTSSNTALEVTNYSMFGCTIMKGKSMIERHKKTVQDSDIIVLEYGGNDSDHDWEEISKDPSGEHLPKTPIGEFERTYRDILEELNGIGKKIVMLNLPPIDEHKYFNWFSRGLNGDNILDWLGGTDEYIYRFHEIYSVRASGIASENNIPMVDIRSAFLEKRNYSDYLCEDGIHPNERGHKLIAEVILNAMPKLESMIEKKQILDKGA